MRRTLLGLLLLAAVPAFAGPGTVSAPVSPSVPPRSAAEMRFKLKTADERLEKLVADANVPPELKEIRTYKAYSSVQLQDPKKLIKVRTLLAFVSDETLDAQIREEAAAALVADRPMKFDCDLALDGRRAARPIAAFSIDVVRLLSDNDLFTRSLAKRILEGLWPSGRDPRIKDYDPRKKDTWGQARAAYMDLFTK